MKEPFHRFRRRDFVRAGVAVVGAYALLKGGARLIGGPQPPTPGPRPALGHLGPRAAIVVEAAAAAIVGPAGAAALAADSWQPARWADTMFAGMAADQRRMATVGLHLFEEWTWGLTGFSGRDAEAQQAILDDWRTSRNALKRSIWGLLHAISVTGFAQSEAGWAHMGYPGPCRGDVGYPARPPGQTAPVVWDPLVP